jgi:MoxR-like ATPase
MMSNEIDRIIATAGEILLGKERVIRLSLACLLARGHLLIEDLPGVGKTTLAHTLAHLLGLHYQRIQFTSDLLPSDIIGVSIFDREKQAFRFHQGPIFAQLVLADEINRATPKTQSALLEAMEEQQITAEGESIPLPMPFFVIATQNPSHQVGTFPLPESQLDRFLMRVHVGYPDRLAERHLLQGSDRRKLIKQQPVVITPAQLANLQGQVDQVHVSNGLLDYCQDLIDYTRNSPQLRHGLSPRAGLSMLQCAKAWSLLEGRDMVLPEDLQSILPSTVGHRLQPLGDAQLSNRNSLVETMLAEVPVP